MFNDTDSILTWLKYTSHSVENIGVMEKASQTKPVLSQYVPTFIFIINIIIIMFF